MKYEIEFVNIQYQFTQDELNQFGPVIARLNQELQEKELEKKTAMSHFKHQLDALKQEFNENCDKLNTGQESREVRARMIKNYATCQREYYSVETFDLVKVAPFKSSDYQRDIDDNGEDRPFGKATDPTPEPEGTAETNPVVYAHLIRELNYWREQWSRIPESFDPDEQIERGLEIQGKITALEITLKAMEPEGTGPVEDSTSVDQVQDPDDETDSESDDANEETLS